MNDLERLELILRRIMARRERDNKDGGAILNIDTQELLKEIADELALSQRASQ